MKKTISIALVVLAALAMFGVGYAWWSETLNVTGTVDTGNLDVAWEFGSPTDTELPGKNFSAATVATKTVTGVDQLTVTVTNAYPSITYTVPVTVRNTGSIPVNVNPITFANLPAWTTVTSTLATGQVHPGATVTGNITIHLKTTAPIAPEGGTHTFTGTLTARQWNAP